MRGKWPFMLCLVTGVVAACDHLPGAQPKGDTWELVLVNQKSSTYGGSACVGQSSETYCKTWLDDAYVFGGTLHRSVQWQLDLGSRGLFSAGDAAQKLDTVVVDLLAPTGCGSYELYFRTQRDSIFGTFLHTSDCHGAGNSGTFVGRP